LKRIDIPTETLLCNDTRFTNVLHLQHLNKYANDITDSFLGLQRPSFRILVQYRVVVASLDGPNMYSQCVKNRFFGTNYGLIAVIPKQE